MENQKANQIKEGKKSYVKWEGILQNCVEGQVRTRFPPEPSGYLHIGHIKAVTLNRFFADLYKGTMIMRYDDTNPDKESQEFADEILNDLKTAQIHYTGEVSHVSDYFEILEEKMTKLITDGYCYCDNTDVETMRKLRDEGTPTGCRDQSPEENLKIWNEMKKKDIAPDSPFKKYCVRGKYHDIKSKNKCMRDPVFYRFVDTPHVRTGDKYKIYPTYDYSIPIVDHLGGVTHMMRTNEYADRIPMYRWVEKLVGLPEMNIYEYSRLNMVHTLLSKRKLKWLVDNQCVDGWDDPRLPTLRGILRRGVRIESVKEFILDIGPSKNTNLMSWDNLYAINVDIIDPDSKRLFGVSAQNSVKVYIENFDESQREGQVDWHPKLLDKGKRTQLRHSELYIEREDTEGLEVDTKLTLYKWGNSKVTKLNKNENGEIQSIQVKLTLDDLDFKKTKKAHWVSALDGDYIKALSYEFDHIINKEKIEEEDKIEEIVNTNSKFESPLLIEKIFIDVLQKGDTIQLERRGFYYVDSIDQGNQTAVLHFIPDGKSSSMSIIGKKVDPKKTSQGIENTKKPKKQEKLEKNKEKKEGTKDPKKKDNLTQEQPKTDA